MKTALAQINPIIGDFKGNIKKIIDYAAKAREAACDLVVFPELCICGYPPKDLLEREDFIRACEKGLMELREKITGIGVVVGLPLPGKKKGDFGLYNSAVLFENREIIARADKRLLPFYDVFDESRYFQPGKEAVGFDYKGFRLGLTICEDAWNDSEFFDHPRYSWDPLKDFARDRVNVLVNIAASPFHAGKISFRARLMGHISKKYGFSSLYVNQVGGNDSLLFDGASTVFGPDGELKAAACDFKEDLVCYDLKTGAGEIHPVSRTKVEAIYSALVMGVYDYITKCGFKKALVGLSGGIDSALTLGLASSALGPENVLAVFMPSPYTSPDNFTDTRTLAENLGVDYKIIPITPLFKAFSESLNDILSEGRPGITEQNIQARIRGVILMAISNKTGALLLSTGNKSEVAVGYSTLYGDMCGGLSVISDLPKAMVYEVSRYINSEKEIIPLNIIEKPPSAELAPDQRDDDDLPPYDILDQILEAYVEERKEPLEIIKSGHDPDVVWDVMKRVNRNEYKRSQAAPGLRITPKAFGEGRRHPIAKKFI